MMQSTIRIADKQFQIGNFHSLDVTLSYIEAPTGGQPLILLHGVGSRWQPFQSILPQLAEVYHVFALDLRGHGQSSHTPGAYRLVDYTEDVYHFITEQFQAPVVIYGHSLGALVGIYLASQHPELVRALILGDPPLYHHNTLTKDTFWQTAFTDLLDFIAAHPDPVEMDAWLAQNMPGMPPERRTERVQSLKTLDAGVVRAVIDNTQMEGVSLSACVSQIRCPVLLLRGNPDLGSALREQDVAFALEHFQKIGVLNMETVGHGIIPVSLLQDIMEFINRL